MQNENAGFLVQKAGKNRKCFFLLQFLSASVMMVFISYGMSCSLGRSQGKCRPSQVQGPYPVTPNADASDSGLPMPVPGPVPQVASGRGCWVGERATEYLSWEAGPHVS